MGPQRRAKALIVKLGISPRFGVAPIRGRYRTRKERQGQRVKAKGKKLLADDWRLKAESFWKTKPPICMKTKEVDRKK